MKGALQIFTSNCICRIEGLKQNLLNHYGKKTTYNYDGHFQIYLQVKEFVQAP